MQIEIIDLGNSSAIGLKMEMEHAPLLVIRANKGFVMCGYLNMEAANKLGDTAVRVTGVRTFEDVLTAKAVDVSEAAKRLGISTGMPAKEALLLMSEIRPGRSEKAKQNCWEFKKCGREPGGVNSHNDECPAATFSLADGFCEGKNGGRACVYITGTYCDNKIQGTHREKEKNCQVCGFYNQLRSECKDEMNIFAFDMYSKEKLSELVSLTTKS
jgi:uncharacterized protein YunC (DUF1805 family)